ILSRIFDSLIGFKNKPNKKCQTHNSRLSCYKKIYVVNWLQISKIIIYPLIVGKLIQIIIYSYSKNGIFFYHENRIFNLKFEIFIEFLFIKFLYFILNFKLKTEN